MLSAAVDIVIGNIIETVERRAMFLTGIAIVLAVGLGATIAATGTVPWCVKFIYQLDWKLLLTFGPLTAVIIAHILAAVLWGEALLHGPCADEEPARVRQASTIRPLRQGL